MSSSVVRFSSVNNDCQLIPLSHCLRVLPESCPSNKCSSICPRVHTLTSSHWKPFLPWIICSTKKAFLQIRIISTNKLSSCFKIEISCAPIPCRNLIQNMYCVDSPYLKIIFYCKIQNCFYKIFVEFETQFPITTSWRNINHT